MNRSLIQRLSSMCVYAITYTLVCNSLSFSQEVTEGRKKLAASENSHILRYLVLKRKRKNSCSM